MICLHECEPDAELVVGDSVMAYLKGEKGDPGDPGPTGPGVPDGGTTGQVLAKRSDDDQDTEWVDASGGGAPIDNETLVIENGVLRVNTTDLAVQDNTRPITSSGVYVIVGNINSLLELI